MPEVKKREMGARRPGPERTLTRDVQISVRAIDEAKRTVELSFSSEAPVETWWGTEILSHDDGAVDFSRLLEVGVVLFNHDRGLPLGKILEAGLDTTQRKGRALVQFDDDEVSDWYFQKVVNETLRGVSVGYRVSVWETVAANATSSNGRFAGPVDIATRWTPYELSICSVPADASVGVGRSDDGAQPEPNNNTPSALTPAALPIPGEGKERDSGQIRAEPAAQNREDSNNMPTTATKTEPVKQGERQEGEPVAQPAAQPAQADERQAAIDAERKRVSEVLTLCREFEVDASEYLQKGSSVDEVRAAILEKLSKERAAVPGTVQVTKDATDKFRDAASHALLLRAGMDLSKAGIQKPADGAMELRGMSLRSLMEEFLRMQGKPNAARMEVETLMREVFTPDSAFASILDSTIGHSMMIGHTVAPTTFQVWTREGSLSNFKSTPRFRLSEGGKPKQVLQNGELQRDEMADEGVNAKLNSYGITWGLTRQAIINDDLDVISTMPMRYAIACRRQINGDVYAVLNANPAIYDGTALFHADHANLAGVGAVIGLSTIGTGRAAMRKQKGLKNDQPLNLVPRYVICSPEKETDAEQFLTSISDVAKANAAAKNVFYGALSLVADADLSSANPWFLAADPTIADTVEVAYLNGNAAPTIESRIGWDVLGMEWRLYHDWGITVLDYRGMYKNPGA